MSGLAIKTVSGVITPKEVGITLTHEHIYGNFSRPSDASDRKAQLEEKIVINNLPKLKRFPYCSLENLVMRENKICRNSLVRDLIDFKFTGGSVVVDCSSHGLWDHKRHQLNFINQLTDVHIVSGTGYYSVEYQNTSDINLRKEEMYDKIKNDLCGNVNGCGLIGEIGCSWPIHDFEKKSIMAAGEVQADLKCPVAFNSAENDQAIREMIRIYQESGGDSKKLALSHIINIFRTKETLLEFLDEVTCFCQFDEFGVEYFPDPTKSDEFWLSDVERLEFVKILKDEEKIDLALMSHDIHTKHRWSDFGGNGFSHINRNIIPIMKRRGFSENDIDRITIENPRNWLQMIIVS